MILSRGKVLDSSVVLAALRNERSDENLLDLIEGAILSTVNLSEVLSKAAELGLAQAPKLEALLESLGRVEPFTAAQAKTSGQIWLATRTSGLSLGGQSLFGISDRTWGRGLYGGSRVGGRAGRLRDSSDPLDELMRMTMAAVRSGCDPVGKLPEAAIHRWLDMQIVCPKCDAAYNLVCDYDWAISRRFEEESRKMIMLLKKSIFMGHAYGHWVVHFETSGVVVKIFGEPPETKKTRVLPVM